MGQADPKLAAALEAGDPDAVAALIAAGVDVHYRNDDGYDAMIDAVHGPDARLLEMLALLLRAGVDPNGVTTYNESPLRVLSRLGRFDGVKLLLEAGADRGQLGWTPLIEAVAIGSLEDVDARIAAGDSLEAVDWWERTAWLVALLAGDAAKAKRLLAAGANPDARGRCRMPPLFYAIAGSHPQIVKWLIEIGQDIEATDEFGTTPLMQAVGYDDLDSVNALLAAGANIARHSTARESTLQQASSRAIANRLLDAGADPQELSQAGRRTLLGYEAEPDEGLLTASPQDFARAHTRRFGAANPERMDEPFWQSMIRAGINAYQAGQRLAPDAGLPRGPIWCAQRFGQSLTFLPDGRIVQIGGEHEDWYDSDFCIYNDVFVHGADGSIAIHGYPEATFPPTDFHTATLVGDHIYVIGSLGYQGARRFGETPIHRLDLRTFRMERLEAGGDAPGWIYRHRATQAAPREIRISGGKIARLVDEDKKEDHVDNTDRFILDVERLRWRREGPT